MSKRQTFMCDGDVLDAIPEPYKAYCSLFYSIHINPSGNSYQGITVYYDHRTEEIVSLFTQATGGILTLAHGG